jgi:hypothetical protein
MWARTTNLTPSDVVVRKRGHQQSKDPVMGEGRRSVMDGPQGDKQPLNVKNGI